VFFPPSKHAAKLEESEKILIDPTVEGKTREKMGLEPFVATEIRASIMGVPVFINQEIIAYVIWRASKGNFKEGLDNNKKSPWNDIVNEPLGDCWNKMCLTLPFESFDDNKVLKIVNWIC